MIEDLCKKLKDKRAEEGYNLEDIVEKTKLHPSVIKAIENCHLDEISPVYLKGFIKIYASFLEINIGDDLKDIALGAESARVYRARKQPAVKVKVDFLKILTPRLKRNIAFAAVVIIVFIIIGILFSSVVRFIKQNISARSGSNNIKVKAGKVIKLSPLKKTKEITVFLRAKRDCFVRVKRDGTVVFDGILRKGALEQWQAENELEFKINDASSIELSLNGRILPPLSKIHQPIKSLKITAKGISIKK